MARSDSGDLDDEQEGAHNQPEAADPSGDAADLVLIGVAVALPPGPRQCLTVRGLLELLPTPVGVPGQEPAEVRHQDCGEHKNSATGNCQDGELCYGLAAEGITPFIGNGTAGPKSARRDC
jgi:hypothetical protein